MKLEDCIDGEVYFWEGAGKYLNLFQTTGSKNIECYIDIDDLRFTGESNNTSPINIRLATPEEKHWLLECKKENKFIPYDEAMKSFIKVELDTCDRKPNPQLKRLLKRILITQ